MRSLILLSQPGGQFCALDHFINHCQRALYAPDFKTTAQQSNLSVSEKKAQTHNNIVIKLADKGGAVIVIGYALSISLTEANCQISSGRFYEPMDHVHVPIEENQCNGEINGYCNDQLQPASTIC